MELIIIIIHNVCAESFYDRKGESNHSPEISDREVCVCVCGGGGGGGRGIRYPHLPSSLGGVGGGGVLSKFRIGQSELCPSQRCSMTTQHPLQACPLHHNLTCHLWPVRSGTASQASLLAELSELDLSSQVTDKKEENYSTELTSNTCN